MTITASPVSVDFHGTAIPTFNVEGIVRVAMKPICQSIGLDWKSQYSRIKRHPVLSKGMVMMTTPSKGGIQKYITLPLNKLNGWLFGIDTNRVKPEIRERLVEYQAECFDVLADYWQKGQATNPRTTPDERAGLRAAVTMLTTKKSLMHNDAYRLVHQRFNVEHIDELGTEQLPEAVAYVHRLALEGEWLGRDTPQAENAIIIDYPLIRPWQEWREGQLVGDDAMYHSGLRQLFQQLGEAERSGDAVTVRNVAGLREEFKALTSLCETQGIKRRHAEAKLEHVRNFTRSMASSVNGIGATLER